MELKPQRVVLIGRRKHLISAEAGLYRAMKRMGHEVWLIDDRKLRQRIGARAGSRWIQLRVNMIRPHRILVFKPHDVTAEVMDALAREFPTNMWYRDFPVDPALVRRARHIETVFLTAGGQAPEWEQQGVQQARWLPDGADPDLHKPAQFDPRFACDVAFIGRGIWPGPDYSRAEFLVRLAKRFHVRVWGQDWERWAKELQWHGETAYNEDFAKVCASARIVIDVKPAVWSEEKGAYLSNRLVRQLACGGFSLSRGSELERETFREGEHCAWYTTEAEAFEKIAYYIEHDAERRGIAQAAVELVHKHHLLAHRVPNLLTGQPYRNPLEVN